VTDGGGENRNPAWFPDGRTIAFASTQGVASSARKVSRLGGSTSLLVENAETPAISPDGASIAFSRVTESGLHRIWVAPLADPARAIRLTGDDDGSWEHTSPAWSPDGSRVCYAAFKDIWAVPSAGGKPEKLSQDGILGSEPVYAPDGGYVYFTSRRSGARSLWRVPARGGASEQVISGTGTARHPSFSRDGRRLVFASFVADVHVVLLDRKTGAIGRIATTRDDEDAALAPDGSAVAWLSNRLGPWDLWIQDVRNGRLGVGPARRLTTFESGVATPAFSPNGRTIAFSGRPTPGHREIWAAPLDGGAAFPLVRSGADNIHPSYAPDMSRLAFASDRAGRLNVWVVALKDGRPEGDPWPLTTGAGTDAFPTWSPDGGRIAYLHGTDVWIVEARPGAEPRAVLSGAGVQAVAFEPDGSTILAPGLYGAPTLHLRRIKIETGESAPLTPPLALGDRNAQGSISLSRDGRLVATNATELTGNIWMATAARDGR
jgi:Tol biopolymer transport system component